jgi:sigma-B regulation protein RsbU (phosphoserine phosphatase)
MPKKLSRCPASTPGYVLTRTREVRGGDIHYLSTCAHSNVLRFAVADVAGHGTEVADVAARFKRLIVRHINKFDQRRLARSLNEEFLRDNEGGRFVTTLLTSYYRPIGHLLICNAGHPRPLLYWSEANAWELIDYAMETKVEPLMNLPLGIIELTNYYQFAVQLFPGDYVIFYSDGYTDIRRDGEMLGEQGLLEVVRSLSSTSAAELGERIYTDLGMNEPGYKRADDETLIVLAPQDQPPPRFTIAERLAAMCKTLGLVKIQ